MPDDGRRALAWAWASLIANITITLTGGLVRLTGSGLGCPTWPKCTAQSWTTHRALGIHGTIEFGNRLLTYVLVAVAVGTAIAVWRRAASTTAARVLAGGLVVGIPLQGLIGGLTVLTHLNPWTVSLHLVVSMLLVAGSAWLIEVIRAPRSGPVSGTGRRLVVVQAALVAAAVYAGTMVTGSGPHAGDADARRNGLDPLMLTHLHAGVVCALVACSLLSTIVFWRSPARSVAAAVLVVEVAQAAVGIAQYALGLPIGLVAVHLVSATVLVATSTTLVLRTVSAAQPEG